MTEKVYDSKFNEWNDIYDITFMFNTPNHKSHKLQSICTFDIEASTGFMQKDHTVISFDHDK